MFPNHIKSGILCELALACRSLADLDQHNYDSRVWSGDFVEVFLKREKVPKNNWVRVERFGLRFEFVC